MKNNDITMTINIDEQPLVILHTMSDCHLCIKCKHLLQHWNISYATVEDNPSSDEPYPILFINGNKHSYEMLLQKIKNGEIGS
uniref:Glutaredoxin domain-containing protein n=1 Tax=viral metagenome TaxID=1070528 RepID=A0A6M3KZI6_9ZZZZ